MRVLGIGNYCDLAALYLRLSAEGHEVKVFIDAPLCQNILNGMIAKTNDWRSDLQWVKSAGGEGIILFENVSFGGLQDELREEGFNVIGGSAFGDRLEIDRAYAQSLLAELGLSTAPFFEKAGGVALPSRAPRTLRPQIQCAGIGASQLRLRSRRRTRHFRAAAKSAKHSS